MKICVEHGSMISNCVSFPGLNLITLLKIERLKRNEERNVHEILCSHTFIMQFKSRNGKCMQNFNVDSHDEI